MPSKNKKTRIHYPKAREVLGCDFHGLVEPEMIKRRQVIILSYSRARPGLAVVVPLSTTAPNPQQSWHYELTHDALLGRRRIWVKADMIYTVSLSRLFLWHYGRDEKGNRIKLYGYRISESDFTAVQDAVLSALKITRS